MKIRTALSTTAMFLFAAGCTQKENTEGFKSYGAPIAPASVMTVSDVVEKADGLGDQKVMVKGEITDVCQTRGCWMTLAHGEEGVRVRFTSSPQCTDGFFVPRNAKGHKVYLMGSVISTEISEADARHYAQDAGQSEEEIAKISGPQKEVTIVAEGVLISDGDKLDPPAS